MCVTKQTHYKKYFRCPIYSKKILDVGEKMEEEGRRASSSSFLFHSFPRRPKDEGGIIRFPPFLSSFSPLLPSAFSKDFPSPLKLERFEKSNKMSLKILGFFSKEVGESHSCDFQLGRKRAAGEKKKIKETPMMSKKGEKGNGRNGDKVDLWLWDSKILILMFCISIN